MKKTHAPNPAKDGDEMPENLAGDIKSQAAAAPIRQEEDDRLQADLDRFRDLALRSQADFENYKKRAAREKEEAIKYANNSLLEKLMPVVDNFELGLEAARSEGETSQSLPV